MFNRQSLRLGITGAVLFIILGSLTACSDNNPTEPTEVTARYDHTGCYIDAKGNVVCP